MNFFFNIGARKIYRDFGKCFIIAEIGINHLGSFELCKKLIESAAKSKADAVKLQTINPDESYVRGTISYKQFKNKQLSDEEMYKLFKFAKHKKLGFFSTPGDFSSLYKLLKLNVDAIKISSGLLTNIPLIEEAAKSGKPIIISTGMGKEKEIINAYKATKKNNCTKLALLKCTSIYPAPDHTLNLNSIYNFKKKFGVPIGYSDHTIDDVAVISAVSMGATIIEKHFTTDNNLIGADHKISMLPDNFYKMVKKIRRIEKMFGANKIAPHFEELSERPKKHRYIVAKKDLKSNEKINLENIAFKRIKKPSKLAIEPVYFKEIKNKKIKKKIKKNSIVKMTNIK